jgi:hypothetical protein
LAVNWSAGDTIEKALQVASTTFEPAVITVSGVCNERVVIARDDVTLEASSAGAVLDGAGLPGTDPLVIVATAHRVVLSSLTLTPGGITGLQLDPGSAVLATGLEITEASRGIVLRGGSQLTLSASTVLESKQSGISNEGGTLEMLGTTVAKGAETGVGVDGGSLLMSNCHVDDNDAWGVAVMSAGHATITGTSIDRNAVGLLARMNAAVLVGMGTTVNSNRLQGIRVWDGSSVLLGIGSSVAGNSLSGVEVEGGSVLVPQQTTIKGNGSHGVEVRDTSLVKSTSGQFPKIYLNSGWGVWCEGTPGDARLGSPGFPAAAVFGNAGGQLSCPGYFLP